MPIKIGINGFGRVGRSSFRFASRQPEVEIVAVNDLADAAANAQWLQYDSIYGAYPGQVKVEAGKIEVDGRVTKIFAEKDPAQIPWGDLGVDVVIETAGELRDRAAAEACRQAGVKKVIIAAPAKEADITVVLGVNEEKYDPARHHIIAGASSTMNCLAPAAKVLNDAFGIAKGMVTAIHSDTNDHDILDIAHNDWRRDRAASLSIVPAATDVAAKLGDVIPELDGKLNGFAMRVPTPAVSTLDFVAELATEASVDAVNEAYRAAAQGRMKGYLAVSDEPLVSVDFRGNPFSCVVDAPMTMAIGGNLIKVITWYDNEWAYACRLLDLAVYSMGQGK
ncbi:MAG: type I glyceraldehyde-3-phosphate dehydrogenase [bacterium]|jgi:glyceraldehyde 3-phosphate dehydrogenase